MLPRLEVSLFLMTYEAYTSSSLPADAVFNIVRKLCAWLLQR